jgi:hypothetical protein
MLALIALFLIGILTGANSERPNFWLLAALLGLVFLLLAFMWHSINHWPGLLSPAWVDMFAQMVFATVIGLMLGGIFLSPKREKIN